MRFAALGKLLKDILSGPGNEYFDMGRLLWGLSVLSMIGYQGFAIYRGQVFDPISFGAGAAGILAGGGAGTALKDTAGRKKAAPVVQGDLNTQNIETVRMEESK
jgi:hypothetical protein